jgi:hypothetical protein
MVRKVHLQTNVVLNSIDVEMENGTDEIGVILLIEHIMKHVIQHRQNG